MELGKLTILKIDFTEVFEHFSSVLYGYNKEDTEVYEAIELVVWSIVKSFSLFTKKSVTQESGGKFIIASGDEDDSIATTVFTYDLLSEMSNKSYRVEQDLLLQIIDTYGDYLLKKLLLYFTINDLNRIYQTGYTYSGGVFYLVFAIL